jgi:7,8-dihydropterin-6-yl-methyl-4-(beta-D-ribofuranosyl)aminobenzene 5'-phosphate synthase
MNPAVRTAYEAALSNAQAAEARGDLDRAFAELERAHILGQRHLLPHIVTHLRMLRIGWRRRDRREVAGQVVRLIATLPGFLSGWVPKGNPGGANISALKPVPLPADLQPLLADFSVRRDVAKRLVVYGSAAALAFGVLAAMDLQRGREAAEIERAWQARQPQRLTDFGTTRSLEVIPVVNFRARPGLKSEAGVSYLVKTDTQTILFDLGFNRRDEAVSPLQHNLAALGIERTKLDAVFLSHAHRDHLGGAAWEKSRSFGFGPTQPPLGATRAIAPVALSYPGSTVEVADRPTALMPGVASTGPIARRLFIGRIDEQALVIHLEGRGLVAIVGCGHQTMPKLLQHIRENFDAPLIGLIGDVHYPHPEGRLWMYGIEVQRRLASGEGLWAPLGIEQIGAELTAFAGQLQFLALGSHDTSDAVLDLAERTLGDRFQRVVAGEPIRVIAATARRPAP